MISDIHSPSPTDHYLSVLRRLSLLILAAALLGLNACASTQSKASPSNTNFFRSKDYIVYQLTGSQSPAELAEKFLGDPQHAWIIREANPDIRFRRVEFIRGEVVLEPCENLYGIFIFPFIKKYHPPCIEYRGVLGSSGLLFILAGTAEKHHAAYQQHANELKMFDLHVIIPFHVENNQSYIKMSLSSTL